MTSSGPKRYPSAGRFDCFPRCTSWPRRPPRARPSCRTAGPCRMANRQDCNVPRMSIRTMVLDRKESWRTRTSYEAASKRSSPQDQELYLMSEAIWSTKSNVQSAADSSRTWPRVAFMVCLDRGICCADVDMSKTSTYSSRTCLVTFMCVRGIGHEDSRGTYNLSRGLTMVSCKKTLRECFKKFVLPPAPSRSAFREKHCHQSYLA